MCRCEGHCSGSVPAETLEPAIEARLYGYEFIETVQSKDFSQAVSEKYL